MVTYVSVKRAMVMEGNTGTPMKLNFAVSLTLVTNAAKDSRHVPFGSLYP